MSSGTSVKQESDAIKREDGGAVKKEEPASDAVTPVPPPVTFRDIPLYSSSTGDWKHHLMKLASHARVNPSDTSQFPGPVRLNRKLPPREKDRLPKAGSPVLDQYGNAVMVPVPPPEDDSNPATPSGAPVKRAPLLWPFPDDDFAPIEAALNRLNPAKGPTADAGLIGPSATANNATRQKAGMFQKRVREVYKASSVARKTMNEEALPWVLEDWETKKKWEPARTVNKKGLKALELAVKARKEGAAWPVRISTKVKPEEDEDVKKEEGIGNRGGRKGKKKEEDSSEEDEEDPHGANHSPWIGKLDGEAHESASTSAGGAMSHALFIFDDRGAGGFRMVPVSRMYKFLQRPKHANRIGWEEAEELYKKQQKARMGEGVLDRYINRHDGDDNQSAAGRRGLRGGGLGAGSFGGGSGSGSNSAGSWSGRGGAGGVKKEDDDISFLKGLALPGSFSASRSNVYDRDSSSRRNKFTAVSSGPRVKSEEGTYGEIDFEESFADDEERNEGDDYALGEEETKELEQKLKREMAKAEEDAAREDADEDEDLFDDGRGRRGRREDDQLTGSGKQMRKIMRALGRREGNDAYDDDEEERNPYASEDSEDEDAVMNNPEEALRKVREDKEREAREAAKSGTATNGETSKLPSNEVSRANTPSGRSEKHAQQGNAAVRGQTPQQANRRPVQQQQQQPQVRPGAGHASVAQRATSPNRAGSHSRQGSRSGSPDRATPPPPSLKRKSDTAGSGPNTPSSHGRQDSNDASKRPRTSSTLQQQQQRGGSQSRSNSQPGSPRSEETAATGARSPTGTGTRSPPVHVGSRSGSPSRREGGQRVPATPLEQEILDLVKSGAVKDTKELIRHFFKAGRLNPPNFKTQLTSAVTAVLIKGEDSSLNPKPGY